MSHKIIDGKKQAQVVNDEVCARVNMLTDLGWRPRLVSVDIGDSAAVIDIGINLIEVTKSDGAKGTKTVGDVDFNSVHEVAGWITPVPGGVGPMTVAMLLRNTVVVTERQKKRYEDAMRE